MNQSKEVKVTKFYVGGMACSFCASTIEKGLSKINGVESVKVFMESGEAIIKHDKSLVNEELIKKEIEKLDYYVFDKTFDSLTVLKDSRRRALISWLLTTFSFILTLPMMIPIYILPFYTFYINILIVTFNLAYIASPIHEGALNALRKGILNEHVLYGISGISAYILGLLGILYPNLREFLFISALLTSLHLTSGWMGAILRYKVEKALSKIIDLRPPVAHLIDGRVIPITQLKQGDIIIIKPGEKIPLDGVVIDGESEISEAIITGESEPVIKRSGDTVIGGSTNGNGYLTVKISQDYSSSYLTRILGLVNNVKQEKSRMLTFFDKIIDKIWVPLVLVISFSTFLGWLIIGSWEYGLVNALLVMVIGYPCAIGFSYPSVGLSLYEKYINRGILVKNINILEKFSNIKAMILDKTGTLTFGVPTVKRFYGDIKALVYAASIERFSSHPIAKAIVHYAERMNLRFLEVKNFREIVGKGVIGEVEGNEVFVGRREIIDCNGREDIKHNEDINIIVCVNGRIKGGFEIKDDLRSDSEKFVKEIKKLGIKPIILSGDKENIVKAIAEKVGIEEYYGSLLPQDKEKIVKVIKRKLNGNVMMIGDGVNDSLSLALSDISVAMGNAIDISKNVADIILIGNNFNSLLTMIKRRSRLSKAAPINVIVALSYNAIGIPLAILGLLSGYLAMLIMILSLISVFTNARFTTIYA